MPRKINYSEDKRLNRYSSVLESPPYPELYPKDCNKSGGETERNTEERRDGERKDGAWEG